MAKTGSNHSDYPVDSRGFTLVELLMALAITAFLMITAVTFYIAQQRTANAQQDLAIIQQDLRAAMQVLVRDIHMAGFDPGESGNFGFVAAGTFFNAGGTRSTAVATNSQSLAFTSDLNSNGRIDLGAFDVDGNGISDTREYESTAYRLNVNALQRFSAGTGNPMWASVADNIEDIDFIFQLANGNWVANPSAAQQGDIRAVRISILARAAYPDQSYVDRNVYTALSGRQFNGGQPYNDNLRRRLLLMTVQCRNMGRL